MNISSVHTQMPGLGTYSKLSSLRSYLSLLYPTTNRSIGGRLKKTQTTHKLQDKDSFSMLMLIKNKTQ